MIKLIHIVKSYGSQEVIKDISLNLGTPGVVGLLGQNGAGKSTLMNIITGYLSPTNGEVMIFDKDMFKNPKEAKAHIGYLPEKPPLYQDLSVMQYLRFIFEIKKCKLDLKSHLEGICKELDLTNVKDRIIKNLSKGYQQRIGIAQALVGNPEILILDEPTIGLDPKQIIYVRRLIRKLGEEKLVIISSHMLSEIQAISSKIIVLNEGKLLEVGSYEELKEKILTGNKIVIGLRGENTNLENCMTKLRGISTIDQISSDDACEKYYLLNSQDNTDIRAMIAKIVFESGVDLIDMHAQAFTLEDAYIELLDGGMMDESNL